MRYVMMWAMAVLFVGSAPARATDDDDALAALAIAMANRRRPDTPPAPGPRPVTPPCTFCDGCKCDVGKCPAQCPVATTAPVATYRAEYYTHRGVTYVRYVPTNAGCPGGVCPLPR